VALQALLPALLSIIQPAPPEGKMARRILDFFLFSNIFVSLCAASLVAVSRILLSSPTGYYLEAFVFCSTLSVYNFQRIFPFIFGEMNDGLSERQKWIYHNLSLLISISSISLFIGSGIFLFWVQHWLKVLILLFPLFLISFWYAVDLKRVLKFSRARLKKLRMVPYLKLFLIGITWNLVTIALYAIEGNISLLSLDFWWLFLERLLFLIAITLPFDIRDLHQDEKYGVMTIPLKIGVRKTIQLSVVLLSIFGILSLLRIWLLPHTSFAAIPLFLSAIITIAIIIKSNPEKSEYFFSGLVESTMLIQFLLVWIFSLIVG
jgi:4-hydroxybenzoate polyprenyltransferase